MIKDKEEKIQEEKDNPIMEKANKKIFLYIMSAILILLYFVLTYLAYTYLQPNVFERCLQSATMILLAITIVIFEIAYKKDSGLLALNGIEALFIACHALAIPYITTVYKWDLRWYVTISGYAFAIYFVFKSIIVYTSGKKKYLDSFSDIPEIVKKDEPRKKVAIKHNKADGEE